MEMVINYLLWMGKERHGQVTYFITLIVELRSHPGKTEEIGVEKTVEKSWKQHAELWLRGNSVFQGGTVGDGDSHVTDTSSPTKLRSAEHAGLLSAPVFSESCLHPATLASGRGVHVHAREPLYPGRGMHLQKALGYLFLQHNYVFVCVSVCIYLEGRPENIPSNIPYISHCVHCHVTGSQMHQVQGLTFS